MSISDEELRKLLKSYGLILPPRHIETDSIIPELPRLPPPPPIRLSPAGMTVEVAPRVQVPIFPNPYGGYYIQRI